jgi:hypothetical protein
MEESTETNRVGEGASISPSSSLYWKERCLALWSSGQSSWLQIRRPGFDSRHYEKNNSGSGTGSTQPREYNWGATWLKSSGSCLENREYCRRDPSRRPRGTLYPHKLAITSPTSGGHSVGIVRSRTQTMEFFFKNILNMFHSLYVPAWYNILKVGKLFSTVPPPYLYSYARILPLSMLLCIDPLVNTGAYVLTLLSYEMWHRMFLLVHVDTSIS